MEIRLRGWLAAAGAGRRGNPAPRRSAQLTPPGPCPAPVTARSSARPQRGPRPGTGSPAAAPPPAPAATAPAPPEHRHGNFAHRPQLTGRRRPRGAPRPWMPPPAERSPQGPGSGAARESREQRQQVAARLSSLSSPLLFSPHPPPPPPLSLPLLRPAGGSGEAAEGPERGRGARRGHCACPRARREPPAERWMRPCGACGATAAAAAPRSAAHPAALPRPWGSWPPPSSGEQPGPGRRCCGGGCRGRRPDCCTGGLRGWRMLRWPA